VRGAASPPPDRPMGAVLVRAFLFFAAGFLAAFVVTFVVFRIGRRESGAVERSLLDDAAVAAYVLLVTAVPAAAGFAIVTSPWPSWRSLSGARAGWLSAAGGVLTYAAHWTGLADVVLRIPLPAGPLSASLRVLLPGLAVGVLALAAVRLLRLAGAGEAHES